METLESKSEPSKNFNRKSQKLRKNLNLPPSGKKKKLCLFYFYRYSAVMEDRYEPMPRWGHISVAIGDKMYLWGGRIDDFSNESQKKVCEMLA